MTGFALLDVAIGVIFAILTFSLVASAIQESFAQALNWRGRFLRRGLFRLLEAAEDSRALLGNTFFWPTWLGASKSTLERAELTFEVLNDPSLRALHGSKSFFGEVTDWLLALPRLVKRLARKEAVDLAEKARKELNAERTRRVIEAVSDPAIAADAKALGHEIAKIEAEIADRKEAAKAAAKSAGDGEHAHPIRKSGRMPSAIPKETFAQALIDTLHRRIEAKLTEAVDKVKDRADAAAKAVETAIDQTRKDALAEAEAAKKAAEAAGDPPPGDPTTMADDVVYATFGAAAPGKAYAEAYAKSLATAADAAVKELSEVIEQLPMDHALRRRLTRGVRDLAIARAVETRIDDLDRLWDGAEEALTSRVRALEATAADLAEDLARWFDRGMDRVTGWYIRRAKYVLFLIGLAMAAAVNFNVIGYAGELMRNEALRDQVLARAELAVQSGEVGALKVDRSARLALLALAVRQQPGPAADTGKLTEAKVGTYTFTLADLQTLGLTVDAANPDGTLKKLAVPDVTAALQKAAPDIDPDADGDGTVSPDEVRAAVEATIREIGGTLQTALTTLDDQIAGEGYALGWSCGETVWYKCVQEQITYAAAFSWILIGVACTFGGQFWFDLLKSTLSVRTAATGIDSDLKDLIRGTDQNPAKRPRQGAPPAG